MWQIGDAAARPDWRVLDTRLDCNLYAVVQTVEGPYAVGGKGTIAANRGDGWRVVFDDGPATRQNQLRAVDVTDDGERIWLVGSGGSMACYDVPDRRRFDYGYPEELTSTWEAITVSGPRGSEKALAANGSGEILPFAVDGTDPDWGHIDRVADEEATIATLGSTPEGVGFAVDTAGNAFKTTPDEGWTSIGVIDVEATFSDIHAGANEQVYVAAGDGQIYRYGNTYHSWTPVDVGDGVEIRSLDVYGTGDGRKQMTVLSDAGTIYERAASDRWEERPAPTDTRLYSLSLGDPDVIVGKSGTVVERGRAATTAADVADVLESEHVTGYETRSDDRVDTE